MEAVVAGAMAEVLEGIGGRRGVPATRVDANQPVVGILGGTTLTSPHADKPQQRPGPDLLLHRGDLANLTCVVRPSRTLFPCSGGWWMTWRPGAVRPPRPRVLVQGRRRAQLLLR